MDTYLGKNSRRGPQAPALHSEREAPGDERGTCLGAVPKPLRLPTCLSDHGAEARFAVALVFP